MIFCPKCENKLYPVEEKVEDRDRLFNLCMNCGFKKEYDSSIIQKRIYKGKAVGKMNVNQYSRFDVSLPRTNKKECPNDECPTRENRDEQEAVFIMDPVSLKLTYMCTTCGTKWNH